MVGWTRNDLQTFPDDSKSRVKYKEVTVFRMKLLWKAAQNFFQNGRVEDHRQFDLFCNTEKQWLDDYSLFQALNDHYNGKEWVVWERDIWYIENLRLLKMRLMNGKSR